MKELLKKRRPRSLISYIILVAVFAWFISDYMIIEYAYAWFFAINIIAFLAFARDKMAAKVGGLNRTPELTFHMLGILGGFPAILAGRKVLNHKTSKNSFLIPMWLLFFTQLFVAAWFFGNLNEIYAKWQRGTDTPGQTAAPAPAPAPKAPAE